jgi:hypothetical protein
MGVKGTARDRDPYPSSDRVPSLLSSCVALVAVKAVVPAGVEMLTITAPDRVLDRVDIRIGRRDIRWELDIRHCCSPEG